MGDYNRIEGAVQIPLPDGSTLKLGRVTNKVKAKYEDWLEGRARRRVFDCRKELNSVEFKDSMRAVTEACGAGTFCWGGEAWQSSIGQLPGIVKMLTLMSEQAGQEISEDVLLGAMEDHPTFELLSNAMLDQVRASPNFLSAPTRKETTG